MNNLKLAIKEIKSRMKTYDKDSVTYQELKNIVSELEKWDEKYVEY